MIRFLTQVVLLTVVFIAAWRAGGKPERYVATTYFTMLVASSIHALVANPASGVEYEEIVDFRFMLDLAALVSVVFVALRYDRWWTLWVGSVQFIAVMAHFLRALDMPIPLFAYAVMERAPVWIAVILAGIGTLLHARRQRTAVTAT